MAEQVRPDRPARPARPARDSISEGRLPLDTVYAVGDVVTYQGSTYYTPNAFTSGGAFSPSDWLVLAEAGSTGSNGSTGSTGGTGGTGATGATG